MVLGVLGPEPGSERHLASCAGRDGPQRPGRASRVVRRRDLVAGRARDLVRPSPVGGSHAKTVGGVRRPDSRCRPRRPRAAGLGRLSALVHRPLQGRPRRPADQGFGQGLWQPGLRPLLSQRHRDRQRPCRPGRPVRRQRRDPDLDGPRQGRAEGRLQRLPRGRRDHHHPRLPVRRRAAPGGGGRAHHRLRQPLQAPLVPHHQAWATPGGRSGRAEQAQVGQPEEPGGRCWRCRP